MIKTITHHRFFSTWGLVIARIIMGGLFLMACYFKFSNIPGTAMEIAAINFPLPVLFAWLAAIFELFLGIAFLTGYCFREAAMLAIVYVLFLAFAYHGPARWINPAEFGFFVDHFTMVAGLLFMIAHGPGEKLVVKKS